MTWLVSRTMESVHVGILTSRGFSKDGPPWSILGLHPDNVGYDVPVGENLTFDLLELIHKRERKLPSNRLSDTGVGQCLQTIVVKQPHTVCVWRVCIWSNAAETLWGHQSHIFQDQHQHTHLLRHSRDLFSGLGDIFYIGRRIRDGALRDMRSIEPPNRFVTIRGLFFMCRRVSITGEEGIDPL